ncbi:NUDIX domain-containing protein [Patescibacteria group bacterium]|nr:NUDIX domain-containing protein [Patescibacteria group bacterium]
MAFQDTYRLSSHAVITDKDGRVLLLYATYKNGSWGLPGGGVDPGETVEQTLHRECLEELGSKIKILYLSGIYYHKKYNSHVFVFRCELKSNKIKLSEEHSDYKYVDVLELPKVQKQRVKECLDFSGKVKTAIFE